MKRVLRKIKGYFYTGLIALLPIVLTVYIFNWIVGIMMRLLKNSVITIIIERFLLSNFNENKMLFYYTISVYLISFITMMLGICLVGFTLKIMIFAKMMKKIQGLFIKIPLVKQVYVTISQIIDLFISDKEKSYQKVVMVEYPRKGIYSIGFMTAEDNHLIRKKLDEDIKVSNVFIPTSPNPTSGMFVIVPNDEIKVLDIKVDDAIRMIISGGVILPEKEGEISEK